MSPFIRIKQRLVGPGGRWVEEVDESKSTGPPRGAGEFHLAGMMTISSTNCCLGTKHASVLTSGSEQVILRNICPECGQDNLVERGKKMVYVFLILSEFIFVVYFIK